MSPKRTVEEIIQSSSTARKSRRGNKNEPVPAGIDPVDNDVSSNHPSSSSSPAEGTAPDGSPSDNSDGASSNAVEPVASDGQTEEDSPTSQYTITGSGHAVPIEDPHASSTVTPTVPSHSSGEAVASVTTDTVAPTASTDSSGGSTTVGASEGPGNATASEPVGEATDDVEHDAPAVILRTCTVVTNHSGGVPGRIDVANMQKAFRGRDDKRVRLLAMLGQPGSHADAVNLAMADPSLFNGLTRYVTTFDSPPATVVFCLYGLISYNGLQEAPDNRGRQICLAPFDVGLARAMAVLRHLGDEPYFYVGSFRRGVSFSTGQFKSRPGDDMKIFRSVLTRDSPVPVLDGREQRFFWSQYRKLPELCEEDVVKGMVCAVLFTLNFYPTTPKDTIVKSVVRKTAGLNLQAIVVIDDRNPHATADTIGPHRIPLGDDVEEDFTNLVGRAIKPGAVVQAPVTVHDANEVAV